VNCIVYWVDGLAKWRGKVGKTPSSSPTSSKSLLSSKWLLFILWVILTYADLLGILLREVVVLVKRTLLLYGIHFGGYALLLCNLDKSQ